jgi:hypothetical protein
MIGFIPSAPACSPAKDGALASTERTETPQPGPTRSVWMGRRVGAEGENTNMTISEAQREIRTRFVGGFYGQLVAGMVWLTAAVLAVWRGPRASILMLVIGGFFIFPATELLIRAAGQRAPVSSANALRALGMQVAFVLPLSMPLLLPAGLYRLNWFYPAMMILLGAHYLPFVFLYGMRMFAVLAALLVGGGVVIAMYFSSSFSIGAWYTGAILLVFAQLGRMIVNQERRGNTHPAS